MAQRTAARSRMPRGVSSWTPRRPSGRPSGWSSARLALGRVLAEDVRAAAAGPGVRQLRDGRLRGQRAGSHRTPTAGGPSVLRIVDESRAGHPARAPGRAARRSRSRRGGRCPPAPTRSSGSRTQRQDGGERVESLACARDQKSAAPARTSPAGADGAPGAARGSGRRSSACSRSLGTRRVACARGRGSRCSSAAMSCSRRASRCAAGTVSDSNSLTIAALARRAGAEVIRAAPRCPTSRRPPRVRSRPRSRDADVAVICGGVSVGAHDHVRPSLRVARRATRCSGASR